MSIIPLLDDTPPEYDDIVDDWIARGGSGTPAQLLARSVFWDTLRNDGLGTLDRLIADVAGTDKGRCSLLPGRTGLTEALIPDLVGAGAATDTGVNLLAGDYTPTGGIQFTGASSQYLSTGMPGNTFTTSEVGLSVDVHGKTLTASTDIIGVVNAASALPLRLTQSNGTTLVSRSGSNAAVANLTIASNADGLRHLTANTGTSLYTSLGATDGATTVTDRSGVTHSTGTIFVGAGNVVGTGAGGFLTGRILWYGIHFSLDAAQKASLLSALTTFYAAVGAT